MDHALALLYSPFPSIEAARAAAQSLLVEKLAACCNLIPGVESHYMWEGVPTAATEVILIAKTPADQAAAAAARIAALHPYACPAILTLPANANAAFALWAREQTGGRPPFRTGA